MWTALRCPSAGARPPPARLSLGGAGGAATSVLLAAPPLVDGVGGRYFEDCDEAAPVRSRAESDGRHGVAPFALDPGDARRLRELSERPVPV